MRPAMSEDSHAPPATAWTPMQFAFRGSLSGLVLVFAWPSIRMLGQVYWHNPDYAHGLLGPVLALVLARERLGRLQTSIVRPSFASPISTANTGSTSWNLFFPSHKAPMSPPFVPTLSATSFVDTEAASSPLATPTR